MQIRQSVPLSEYTSMHIGGPAQYFIEITNKDELAEAVEFANKKKLPLKVIGGGTNIIFSDAGFAGLIVHNRMTGIDVQGLSLQAQGGTLWDDVVAKSVECGLSGIEGLSKIPGSAGATPVQNVGAYGQEIADTLVSLEAYDLRENQFVILSNEECEFSYRNSIFKDPSRSKDRYIITSILLKLSKSKPKPPFYSGIEEYLNRHGLTPTVTSIREAVTTLRTVKLPDPSTVPNNGSFFQNPFVDEVKLSELLREHPNMPHYPTADLNEHKLSAGWLIEQCGFKNQEVCGLRTYKNHALVLTNPDNKGWDELQCAVEKISKAVADKFGLLLLTEPEIVK